MNEIGDELNDKPENNDPVEEPSELTNESDDLKEINDDLPEIFGEDDEIDAELPEIFGEDDEIDTDLPEIFGENDEFDDDLPEIFGDDDEFDDDLPEIFGEPDEGNESNEAEEPDQFNPNEGSENSNESELNEMGGDDESNYDPYEYGGNFEQEGNSEGFYENFNAESMNTVLISENLIYAALKEYIELIVENEDEEMVQGEQTEVDDNKEEISELEEFLNKERERIRLEQKQAELDEGIENEPIDNEEVVEQEQEVGIQENVSEEMVPNNEEEVENLEMKLEEELQSTIPNESIENGKVEEIEEKNEEPQPHVIEENIEGREKDFKVEDEKYEQRQFEIQIKETHDFESEPIAHEKELEFIKEEHEEKEDHDESIKEGELGQIIHELEVIQEINSNETEVLADGQQEELEQDHISPYREKLREIEEYKDSQQELEEILEQTRKIEQEALIEVEQEQEKSDKTIEENYEKAKNLYNQESGKDLIYSKEETIESKQWLGQKKDTEEKQKHLRIQEDFSEVLKKEIEQESDEGINPKLRLLLKEIIENYNFLENLTTRFKELYESAQNKQISKAEKNELNLLINSLKKVGPTKFMLFASIKAIKRYAIKEGFSDKAHLNHTLNNFFTKFLQNNLVFKNIKELINPIEYELFERFMQFTHETELIKDLVNEFNKNGNWIKNLRPTQTFINFIKQKRKLLENNSQNSSSNTTKKQVEILSRYIALITKMKENDTLTRAIKNLILKNKKKFNAFDIEQWLLITNNSARNQLKKMFTEEEYQKYVRTQKHVSIKTIQIIANKKGGKCHTKEIKNAKSKIDLECAEGHEWTTTYNSVVYQKTWCPECHIYVGEEICRQFFERIFKRLFPKSHPPWLNGKELDGYCKGLKVAFERQGIQHRKKAFGLTDEQIRKIQEDDALKLRKCKENGVMLFQIPDEEILSFDKTQNFIVKTYEKLSGKSLGNVPKYNWREFTIENKHAKKFRKYIEEKGGTLLSSYFTAKKQVSILCQRGHKWNTTPDSIYKGNWCPECAGNKKGTTKEYREIGEKFQCELLDQYTNAKTPLRYRCRKGHVFPKGPYWLKKVYKKAKDNPEDFKNICPECEKDQYAHKFQTFVKNKGGTLITPYKGRFKPVQIRCKNEHEWGTTPGAIYQGHWCKTCAINKKMPSKKRQETAKQAFLEKIESSNYTLLSKYERAGKQVKIKCQRNHMFTITPNYFKHLANRKIEPCGKCRKKEV